ncbi:MAG: twin-arginine translocase subunit TatB [Alphaproteobacteria bacterium]|nr:twin-arginine translocase subunit TatB [Alphaproteobacteria bacterium]
MFDIGGWEFLVIVVLAIIVIGPKDLPGAIRSVTQWVRKARALARDFQSGLDEIARETELDKVEQEIRESVDADGLTDGARSIRRDIENTVDPDNEIRGAFADGDHYFDDPADEFDAGPDEAEDDEVRRLKAERQRRLADERDGDAAAAAEPGNDAPDDGEAPAPKAGTGS